jgi:anti-sigma regulatory factor (Ser/Thr protein kinase)
VTLEESFDAGTLPTLRRTVLAAAVAAGLDSTRAGDVVLAVHELAANAVRHGGGAGRLEMAITGAVLRCQVSDAGPAGYASAITAEPWPFQHGHGLWLVDGIADGVAIAPGPAGSEVTVTFNLPGAGSGQAGYLPSVSDRAGARGTGR